jgi:hypothetical protein
MMPAMLGNLRGAARLSAGLISRYARPVSDMRLKVPDTLPAMASRWQMQAGELASTPPCETGSLSAPSAAAMSAVLSGAGAALARLSVRMGTTATKVGLVGISFDDNEANSAAQFRALGERVG